MIRKLQSKPEPYTAVQWTGNNLDEVKEFLGNLFVDWTPHRVIYDVQGDEAWVNRMHWLVRNEETGQVHTRANVDYLDDVTMPATCDIEIIERSKGDISKCPIVPNEIRINGRTVLAPVKFPPVVHEIAFEHRDAVLVTLTVFARRVVIEHQTT